MEDFILERLLRDMTTTFGGDVKPMDLKVMRSGVVDPAMTVQELEELDALIFSLAEIE